MTYEESKSAYQSYVDEHINNVVLIWEEIKNSVLESLNLDQETITKVEANIEKHDESKKSEKEFDAYRAKFFTSEMDTKDIESNFHEAWAHHVANNPHHWDYWVTIHNSLPYPCKMKEEYIIEMLCDWTAMSYKFKGSLVDWYEDNKVKIILALRTREEVENLIPIFESTLSRLTKNS